MFRSNQGSAVLPKVGRTGKGKTAQIRTDRVSVQPPYLVRLFPARTHGGAGAHTHARARVCLYLGQGREVRRSNDWRGFAPSDLSSNLAQP